jgi:hypothetical protein
MKRLRDQRGSADLLVAAAARLVSARARLEDDTARRQRVRARLRRRHAAPRGAAWLRAAAMVLLVCSVAVASAMIGRVAQTIRAHYEAARAAKQAHEPTHRHRAAAPTAPVAASPVPVAAAPAPVAAPAPTIAPTPHHAPAAAPIARDRESDQARLMVDAVRALRHEHDPQRAALLLARYLDRYPDGVAAEDALALALEATLGRDPARAAGFATRYLARYPSGRWSSLARRALEP